MRQGNLLTTFLVIGYDGEASQSRLIDYRRESHLATDEAKLDSLYQHQYRITNSLETKIEGERVGSWKCMCLIPSGFVFADDHDMPSKGRRIFAFSYESGMFYEVFHDGSRPVPVKEKLLCHAPTAV